MEFHKAAASGSCDAPPTDMLTSFKRKLSVFLINSPSDKVIARLIARNSNAVMLAACPDAPAEAAYRLYLAAQVAPGTHTLHVIKRELNLSADGPLNDAYSHILGAVNLETGRLCVIKTLPMHDAEHQQASQAELFAVEHLSLHDPQAPLVKTEVREYHDPAADAREGCSACKLLLMPWLPGSLADFHKLQLSVQLIALGAKRMEQALDFMHGRKMAHMDVKPGNIMLGVDGQWQLGDFGASLLFGSSVPRNIKTLYPGQLPSTASAVIDWRQLVVTVAMLLDMRNMHKVMQFDTPVPAKVKAVCDRGCQEDPELQEVMQRLYHNAEWPQLE